MGNVNVVTAGEGGRRWPRGVRRGILGAVVAVALAAAVLPAGSPLAPRPAAAGAPVILAFQTMLGDSGPYVGSANPLRGIPADSAPWKITSAMGRLTADGKLDISVQGLTLLDGFNPNPTFAGIVSCQSVDSLGNAIVANVATPAFPATRRGNSTISATLTLPSPCFAPIIFVAQPSPQQWFAVTGN